jgi:hypothetical protein
MANIHEQSRLRSCCFKTLISIQMKKLLYTIAIQFLVLTAHSQEAQWVKGLVFLNQSFQSIPLEIPGVMNPNLVPMSKSTVDIPAGTTIYFFYKKKRYELITIQPDMEKRIVVNELINQRKLALKLEK